MVFARRALKMSAAVATVALVALAIGAAAGRWRVVPVYGTGSQTDLNRGDLVMLEPISAMSVQEGDQVFVAIKGEKPTVRTIVLLEDSWERQYRLDSTNGEPISMQLPPTVPKVTRVVPKAGWLFGLLVGPIQAAFLIINGILLVALAQRRPSPPPPPAASSGSNRRRGARLRFRAAAAAVAMTGLGLLLALLA